MLDLARARAGPRTPGSRTTRSAHFGERGVPVLGVCLGHQCIGQLYGGDGRAGAAGDARQDLGDPPHATSACSPACPNPLTATRYHSLVVARDSVPDVLEITAETDDGSVMGLRHRELPIEGVQFHPESILTDAGHDLLRNFLAPRLTSGRVSATGRVSGRRAVAP